MVDALTQLVEGGQFEQALRLAERELLRSGWNRPQLAHVNLIICRSRLGLNDPFGAVPCGLLGAKLARDLGLWDLMAECLLYTGIAMTGTRQYDQALFQFHTYFQYAHLLGSARFLEGSVWRASGIVHQRKLDSGEALNALGRARKWFIGQENVREVFATTSELVNTYLSMHERDADTSLEPVRPLLRYERETARRHPGNPYYRATFLLDEASYYLHAGRIRRSMVRAMQATEVRKEDPILGFHSHMILHHCSNRVGSYKQALGYAVSARVKALQVKHYELEAIASQAMVDIIKQQGNSVVQELDQEYQALGINLHQYLSPEILRRTTH